jgi:hypothetical protein
MPKRKAEQQENHLQGPEVYFCMDVKIIIITNLNIMFYVDII